MSYFASLFLVNHHELLLKLVLLHFIRPKTICWPPDQVCGTAGADTDH